MLTFDPNVTFDPKYVTSDPIDLTFDPKCDL